MSEQKVVICKDLKSELQDFLSSLKYDKLFILMDTNTKEKCFPLVEDIPAFQKAPILVMEAGDMNFCDFFKHTQTMRQSRLLTTR